MRPRTHFPVLLALAVATGCSGMPAGPTATPGSPPLASPSVRPSASPSASWISTPAAEPMTMLAAGDIADCATTDDEATADLLDELLADQGGTVLALGDLAYESGTAAEFANCYEPTWGRHKDRTIPTPGNHEYETAGAAPYFAYFGEVAGDSTQGWNAFEFRSWHVVVLNSNCDEIGGCGPGSPQAQWLVESLPTFSPGPGRCTLAIWHHPRWSSGAEHGADPRTDTLWRLLHDAGADLVLSGHDHGYERFVPMDADGRAEPDGMVQFVVGTGGRYLHPFGTLPPTSAARDNSSHGVLELMLHDDSYDWKFVATEGAFTDSGSADCR